MENLGNDFETTLALAVADAVVTTINVASSVGAPDANFRIRIDDELMLVTSKGAGENWTVQRGVEGTTAAAHLIAAGVYCVATAAGIEQFCNDRYAISGSDNIHQAVAAVELGGHRVVVLDAAGEAIYADRSILSHRDKVLGVTTGAASAGADATIRTYGELTEPSWSWTLDEPVFLGLTGLLTQTVPTSGFVLRIGFPTAATSLFIDIDDAITL